MVMVYGCAGMRDYNGRISFRPRIPERFGGCRFSLTIRGQLLEVDIDSSTARYTLKEGDALTIYHEGEQIDLTREKPEAVRRAGVIAAEEHTGFALPRTEG